MSRVLDYAVWKEHVGRVQRQELARFDLPHEPIDKELTLNRSFARGWPNSLYNDSSKTRMLLTPTGPGRGYGGYGSYGREAGLTPRLGDLKESHERSWRVEKEDSSIDWAPHRSRDGERHELRLPALEEASARVTPRTPRKPPRSRWTSQVQMTAVPEFFCPPL